MIAVATAVMVAVGVGVFVALGRPADLWEAWVVHNAVAGLGLAVVLWLVIRVEPRNLVVWIVALATAVSGFQVLNSGLTVWLLEAADVVGSPQALAPSTLDTATAILQWFNVWSWLLIVVPMATFLPLVFPDGHLPGRRWRPVAWLAVVALVLLAVGMMAAAWPTSTVPVAQAMAAPTGLVAVILAGWPLLMAAVLASLLALILRARTAHGPQRQQIRWAGTGAAVFALIMAVSFLLDSSGELFKMTVIPGLLTLLAGLAVAITRFRLYEIDRIVSRTVTYTLVTAALVALYALITVVPTIVFDLQSDLLVAAATLAAAAAFGPLRRTVQAHVDRRFNRSRYDATRVADRFATRLRDDTTVDQLTSGLTRVVATTVHPRSVSVWLRPGSSQ